MKKIKTGCTTIGSKNMSLRQSLIITSVFTVGADHSMWFFIIISFYYKLSNKVSLNFYNATIKESIHSAIKHSLKQNILLNNIQKKDLQLCLSLKVSNNA